MRIVVAPDAFKGTLSAAEAAAAIAEGLQSALPAVELVCVPLADGGEGTATVWQAAVGGTWQQVPTLDPCGRPIQAAVAWLNPHTAVIEAATAIGLDRLAPSDRNPWHVSSYGLGEVLAKVWRSPSVTDIWVTLGGSATVDGGIGLLQALGIPVLDRQGRSVEPGGAGLAAIASVQWRSVVPAHVRLHVALDVTNPLCGDLGAAHVFAPQKGADAEMVQALETAMQGWATCLGASCKDIDDRAAGMGAAGGLGYALACLGADCQRGIEVIIEATQLRHQVQGADWVITGEGCSDRQSSGGKVVSGVLQLAQELGVPAVILSGAVKYAEVQALFDLGAVAILDATPHSSDDLSDAYARLAWASKQLGRLLGFRALR